MKIGVYLVPSRLRTRDDRGHMSVWWETDGMRQTRGFWPDLSQVPPEQIDSPEAELKFFLSHRVPGLIKNDRIMDDLLEQFGRRILTVAWETPQTVQLEISLAAAPRPHAWYTYNPANFPDSYNCVTWVVEVVNNILGEVLKCDPNGRISLMESFLKGILESPPP